MEGLVSRSRSLALIEGREQAKMIEMPIALAE